jgi:hypothetical protein
MKIMSEKPASFLGFCHPMTLSVAIIMWVLVISLSWWRGYPLMNPSVIIASIYVALLAWDKLDPRVGRFLRPEKPHMTGDSL